jgi:hypothetical protein
MKKSALPLTLFHVAVYRMRTMRIEGLKSPDKSPDKIGLFGPVPPVENTSAHSCEPIGEAPFGALLLWAF